ncbi:MAG: ATP-binding protein [Spirochaetales bacterium]|nr:ATP-binding protein [Spirochaetales bacterium]
MVNPELPVVDPNQFIGQRSTVRRIFSRIGAERPQSVAVIGGRKIGKSSLLNYLNTAQAQQENLTDLENYIFLHFSPQNDPELSVDVLLHRILLDLGATNGGNESLYTTLQRTVEQLHHSGKKIVFMFDDFHNTTTNENFPLEFFSFLRSLANNYNLAYVTSSYLELQKLCVAKDIEESPFFNIFTNVPVGLLKHDEAASLFSRLTGLDEQEVERVVTWCGPSPYVVKLIASRINDAVLNLNNLEKEFLPLLSDYFTMIVSVVPRAAFKPLKELVKGKQPGQHESYLLQPLVRHRFLEEDEDQIMFFSEAFKLFIMKKLTPEMLVGHENKTRQE